jgi:sulfur-carrier protein
MKLRYFAWVRERVGVAEEMFEPDEAVRTIADLIAELSARGENYAYAFENAPLIRAAIDQRHVRHDALIAGGREIAFFPPMTGG